MILTSFLVLIDGAGSAEFFNGLVEQGIDPAKVEGFLEYWRERRAMHKGDHSEIVETQRYGATAACVSAIITSLKEAGSGST